MNEETIESYQPLPKQREFHTSDRYMRCFSGGFGSGKTKTGVWEVIDKGMRYPGNRIGVFRDTMPDLRDSTMQSFFAECPEEFIYTYKRKENLVVLTTGSEILFRSFRAYATSKRNQFESKIKALNLGAFYVDEANEITKEEFMMLQGRLRLDCVPWRGGWLTTNPPSEDHWIFELFAGPEADKKSYFLVQCSTRENPYLPPDFVKNLEKEYPAAWVKKFIDGEFGHMVSGDPVYQNFRAEDAHGNPWHCRLVKYRPQYGSVHRYWDFGYHRPAVVWAQVTPSLVWKIYKEYMGHCTYINDFAPKVIDISNKMFAGAKFLDFCDPAGKEKTDKTDKTTISILQDDFKVKMQYRYSLISEGIDIVQQKINLTADGEPAFQINPTECPTLTAGFTGAYCRARASTGRDMQSSEPIKDGYFEHPQDALRYGAVNVFGSHSGARSKELVIPTPSWLTGRGGPSSIKSNGGLGWKEIGSR